jgi:hypothetical protein
LGLIVNTNRTKPELAATELSAEEADMHMAYVEQQNLDSYAQIVLHASRRKAIFDKCVLKTHPKEVIFKLGDLVQVHRTDLTFTHSNDRKLTPRWSPPFRITLRIRNAYKLQTLNGSQAKGEYSARRLRHFYPRDGMQLAADQERYMAKRKAERKEGDDDEGDKAELSDNEDTGVQDRDNEDEMETRETLVW